MRKSWAGLPQCTANAASKFQFAHDIRIDKRKLRSLFEIAEYRTELIGSQPSTPETHGATIAASPLLRAGSSLDRASGHNVYLDRPEGPVRRI